MSTSTKWAVLLVAVVIVAALFLTMPKTPAVGTIPNASNNVMGNNTLGTVLGFFSSVINGGKLTAPTSNPSLSDSHNAANAGVSAGVPVSQTQGNGLMAPNFLDGTSYVAGSGDVQYV